ncbi:MAG: MarC family protein, partial [Bdellovibrionia bacterium]
KAFVSLFVAIDAVGALPLFLGLSSDFSPAQRKALVRKAVAAAFIVGLIFVFGGQLIFRFLGITENDFRVAGGILLLVFSIRDLVTQEGHQGTPAPENVGIVPIAIPLIMGPAALATLLLGTKEFGELLTFCALIVNLVVVWILFSQASLILKHIGKEAASALAKIFSLLLAAIGVMLIRQGLKGML